MAFFCGVKETPVRHVSDAQEFHNKFALLCICNLNPRTYPQSLEKKAHKHKLFALVNIQMALGQTAGCPRVNRAKKFMCSPRNTGNIDFSLWLTGGLSQGCPDFQKVYVFKVYVPFSCPTQCHSKFPKKTNINLSMSRVFLINKKRLPVERGPA